MKNGIFISIGANLGDRAAQLEAARQKIEARGISIYARSGIYETEPWGMRDQPSFLNQVVQVRTALAPQQLMETLLDIEREMGRVREPGAPNRPRTIDLDLLLYNQQVLHSPVLTLPHPRLHERNFVLFPLVQIAEPFEHPVLKKTIGDLLWACNDPSEVILL
jgi:2-amino-4-hydroxy-6-hydroxymethyldihydropteridine diphosphokinase